MIVKEVVNEAELVERISPSAPSMGHLSMSSFYSSTLSIVVRLAILYLQLLKPNYTPIILSLMLLYFSKNRSPKIDVTSQDGPLANTYILFIFTSLNSMLLSVLHPSQVPL